MIFVRKKLSAKLHCNQLWIQKESRRCAFIGYLACQASAVIRSKGVSQLAGIHSIRFHREWIKRANKWIQIRANRHVTVDFSFEEFHKAFRCAMLTSITSEYDLILNCITVNWTIIQSRLFQMVCTETNGQLCWKRQCNSTRRISKQHFKRILNNKFSLKWRSCDEI